MGGSLRMWREYFPNAEIHGVDLNIKRCDEIPGVSLHALDANNHVEMTKLSQKHGPWDLVIDDGSHTMKHQQSSFVTLWPYVKSDGFYTIEDIHTSFLPKLDSCSVDGRNELHVSTTFKMLEALKYEREFSSRYVTKDKLNEIRSSVQHVTIWVRVPTEHSYDYTSDNSMTSMIRKAK